MREIPYQNVLTKKIKKLLPECEVIKNDARVRQGIPDLLVLNGNKWAMLEVKRSPDAPVRPNQPHYVSKYNRMSFASFIDPTTEEEVLNALQSALGASG